MSLKTMSPFELSLFWCLKLRKSLPKCPFQNVPSKMTLRYFIFARHSSLVFSRVHATLQPALSVGRSVGWSVGRSVGHTLLFFMILFLWPHCSCPNGLVTSNMAPAHPHATSVAVYPALLIEQSHQHSVFHVMFVVVYVIVGLYTILTLGGPRGWKSI